MSLIILFCSMQMLSVVIVCKNGAKVIGETIKSFSGLTDDILVYDNGSTDGTKDKASALAKYDWILSFDADEAADEELKENLLQLDLSDENKVFEFKFKNF